MEDDIHNTNTVLLIGAYGHRVTVHGNYRVSAGALARLEMGSTDKKKLSTKQSTQQNKTNKKNDFKRSDRSHTAEVLALKIL